tara:strand:+ start:654 stop:788 length:135 start_codon:yes stop_codon:yes gene_type:complete
MPRLHHMARGMVTAGRLQQFLMGLSEMDSWPPPAGIKQWRAKDA